MKDDERLSEAGGEGGSGLLDTLLSSGGLGGVSREEPVLGLVGGEEGDRGEYTVGVASKLWDDCVNERSGEH